jgi:hypothetical protein
MSSSCHWISCETGKFCRSQLSTSDFMVCMEMSAWVPAVSEAGRNILRTETRTSLISRELLQLSATSKKVDELIRQDRWINQRNYSAAWSGASYGPGDDGYSGISEILFPLCSPFAHRGTQNGWELLSHPPYGAELAPSDYHFSDP